MLKLHFWNSFNSEEVDVKSFIGEIKTFLTIALFLAHMLC